MRLFNHRHSTTRRPATRRRLGVEALEGREVPACVVSLGGPDTLTITGNGQSDIVILNDNGAGTVWGTATGAGQFQFSGISKVQVATYGGNDRVAYNLVRNMLPGQQRLVTAYLGDGDDSFTANLYKPSVKDGSDIGANASLVIGAFGGAGRDVFALNAYQNVDVAAGARLKVVFLGEDGNDQIAAYYRGKNNGAVAFREFDGGAGNDVVRAALRETAGSTGASAGIVHGGDGNDHLALFLWTVNPPIEGLIDTGAGIDSAIGTPNVVII